MPRPNLKLPDVVVSFNVQVARGGQEAVQSIKAILKDNPRTDVLCLQEAETYVDDLRREFNGGWRVYATKDWKEAGECPVMVRKDDGFPARTYQRGWGTVRNHAHWTGPKHGWDHPGRTWTWVKVGQLYVMSLHRATDGDGKNSKAYREEALSLTRFFRTRVGKPVLVIGDTNTGLKSNHPGSMRQIRDDVNGRLIADEDEPGIDYALTSRSVTGVVRRTKHYGSDHKAAVLSRIQVG